MHKKNGCTQVYVIIGFVSYLPKVGGSVASFIVSLALACSIAFRNCILSPCLCLYKYTVWIHIIVYPEFSYVFQYTNTGIIISIQKWYSFININVKSASGVLFCSQASPWINYYVHYKFFITISDDELIKMFLDTRLLRLQHRC